jgi:hypothetical protein
MEISFKGPYFTKSQRAYLEDMASWSGAKLMGGRLSRHINLTIHLVSEYEYIKTNVYALAEVSDDDERKKPRDFVITMTSKFGTMKSLMILAHEMVHVKQFAIGELSWCSRRDVDIWKGKAIPKSTEYWDYPHEIEAHGREKGLVYQWCDARHHWDKKWCKAIF